MNTNNNCQQQIAVLFQQESGLVQKLQDAHQQIHLDIKLGQKYLTNGDVWDRIESVERQLGKVRTQLRHARRVDPVFNPEAATFDQLLDLLSDDDLSGAFCTDTSREGALAAA